MPGFLRKLSPLDLHGGGADSPSVRARIWVIPDYLAVGSDDDFLYVALGYPFAAAIARELGFVLPTPKIVDRIYEGAALRLTPQPLPPGPLMGSIFYSVWHQALIEDQRRGHPREGLSTGHKKDLVLSNRLHERASRVAIYGWHRGREQPIQPLSTAHGGSYADYSHGVRLVSDTVVVDGRSLSIYAALEDPVAARALSYEGALRDPRGLMQPPMTAAEIGLAGGSR